MRGTGGPKRNSRSRARATVPRRDVAAASCEGVSSRGTVVAPGVRCLLHHLLTPGASVSAAAEQCPPGLCGNIERAVNLLAAVFGAVRGGPVRVERSFAVHTLISVGTEVVALRLHQCRGQPLGT